MAQSSRDSELGKFLSLILRHKPEVVGLTLDEAGWIEVDKLLGALQKNGTDIDKETLERIVATNNKKRYAFNEDHTCIRASQGHSIEVNLGLERQVPPSVLYHGTAKRFLESILDKGIEKRSRQYVHLSRDIDTAIQVGIRHGNPIVLIIDAMSMVEDGYVFYLSENQVWLTEYIPSKYIQVKEVAKNEGIGL